MQNPICEAFKNNRRRSKLFFTRSLSNTPDELQVLNCGSNNNKVYNRLPAYNFIRISNNSFINWWGEAYYPRYVTYKKNIINTVDTRMFNMGDTKYEPGEIKSYAAHFFLIGNTINFERDLRNAHQGLLMIRGVDDFEFSQNTVKAISNRGPLYDFAYCRGTIKNNQIKGNFKPVKSGASVHIWQ